MSFLLLESLDHIEKEVKMAVRKENYDAVCESKYIRCNTFKLRKVADVVRGMNVDQALKILKRMHQVGAEHLYKALHSAAHNAFNTNQLNPQSLSVSFLAVNQGKKIRRFQPRARGRSFSIDKPSSHIIVGLKSTIGVKNGPQS